ncbi:hypothetical protein DFJ67_0915 [Asanoa ferruginea]|uniref:DUF302 domain-containing protein n=1 Tax=Asanoa ferruginea TaxID=53367 RepID=A0A3D9ZC38_9ACTN|nr:hypothetical protein [Asanoa ferruginea]REF94968.1 hypothetical protein DFJ67_0915 [Asanoa ferruginea]GIF48779.1 hypothetical protein Afe04nite_33180 [Asanoa ferruginea]
MAATDIDVTDYTAQRFVIPADAPFADLRQRYEEAVPPADLSAFVDLANRGGKWEDVLTLTDTEAPYGFLNYGAVVAQPVMGVAGDAAPCVTYLMGNHTIAQRMFHHNPLALAYAPLRTAIAADSDDGPARFSIEQPSKAFASFDNDRIAAVGVELDRKVATLLDHLRLPVPPELTA